MNDLPPVLRVQDIARFLHISPRSAQRAITRGELGRYARVSGKLFVRRDAFLSALAKEGKR